MTNESWQKGRWHQQQFGIFDVPKSRPKRWRSSDVKGFLPARVVQHLEIAILSLPQRGPWPEIDEERGGGTY